MRTAIFKYYSKFFFYILLSLFSFLNLYSRPKYEKEVTRFSPITLTVLTTNVSYEYYGVTFYNLTVGYAIFYNGSINITATGGTAPYSYTLLSPYTYQNNGYFTNLGPGSYTIRITDGIGQAIDTTVVVGTLYPQPQLTLANVTRPSSCSSFDGSFTLIGSGGTPPYSYSIDGGATFTTGNTFTNLAQGYYPLLLVKDANGQLAMTGFTYDYNSGNFFGCYCCPFIVLSDLGSASCGNGKGGISAYSINGSPPVQFSDDGVNYYPADYVRHTNGDSQYVRNFQNLNPGLHSIYGKDGNGVISVTAASVLYACALSITYVSVDAACHQNDGSITVTAQNGTSPYTYTLDGIHFQTSNIFTGLGVGNYNIWVKDANGVVNGTIAIVYDKCPMVSVTETDEICGDKSGTIKANGFKGTAPYQFSIDGVNFQSVNVFTNLPSGNYIVTIKDANGFTNTSPIIVNNNCIKAFYLIANTTCGNNNGSITINASNGTPPYNYSLDGINFQTSNSFNNLSAGNYTITVKDAIGVSTSKDTSLAGAPAPQITLATSQASCNNTNGSISFIRNGGTAPFQYSINNGATFQSDSIFNNLDSARYIGYIKDANACITRDTIYLTALPTPSVSLGNDTVLCSGATLQLSVPQVQGYLYLWQDNSNGNMYVVAKPGIFSVKVTNQYGCSTTSNINVHFRPSPVFSLGDDTTLCNGQFLILKPAEILHANYLWNTGSSATKLKVQSSGIYWLQVSDSGCIKRDSIVVSYKPNPTINLGNDTTVCEGQTLLLNVTNNNAAYLWQDGSSSPTYTVTHAGVYSVKVFQNGCDTSGNIRISYNSKPLIGIVADTSICITQQLVLNASYPNSTYEWQDGTTSPQYLVTKEGKYTVQVTNSCGFTAATSIVSYENCACKFYVPNAFTPNGDGKNDVFRPKYQCLFSSYELKIFNRLGQLIFISRNVADGWNGTFNNNPQPTGAYVWQLSYNDNLTGKLVRKNGTIVLIR